MDRSRGWIRAVLAFLAVEQLVTGGWAVFDPRGWFGGFPGLGRHWVAVDGPFNHHLTVDAGSGFLAAGVLLAAAAIGGRRSLAGAALVAFLIEDVPHVIYHASHPAARLGTADKVLSTGGLAFSAALAVICLAAMRREPAGSPGSAVLAGADTSS